MKHLELTVRLTVRLPLIEKMKRSRMRRRKRRSRKRRRGGGENRKKMCKCLENEFVFLSSFFLFVKLNLLN